MYASKGLVEHYDGYFCLCECDATDEGIFCSGAGIQNDNVTKVASFLGVFEETETGWRGDLSAFDTDKPFRDSFTMSGPGGASNYTGVSQALGAESFVWRGYMSGVDCGFGHVCEGVCGDFDGFGKWMESCEKM